MSNSKVLNLFIWVVMATLFLITLFVNYEYSSVAGPVKLAGWLIWTVVTLVLFGLTSFGKLSLDYFLKAKDELRKVSWPSRQETTQTTLVVVVFVFIIGMVLWMFDASMLWVVGKLTQLGG